MVEKEALRLELLVIMTLSVCILEFKVNGSDMYTQEVVSRRHGGDIYQLSTRDEIVSQTCHDDNNLTYLVSEQRCVRNQELLNDRGCRFSVAPNEEFSYTTLTFVITECNRQLQCLRLMTAATFNSSGQLANATIVYNETHQHHDVVSPSCHITSLEVYRGRDQVIRISHDGFSLSDNGTVEINSTNLAYSFEEYLGELYRMNLSCSDGPGGSPESGCLFFKVIGTTNVTASKFKEPKATDSDTSFSPTISKSSPTTTKTLSTSSPSEGPDLFIYIIVAATGIVALLFVVVLLCMILAYCCSLEKKRNQRQAVTVATNLWFEQRDLIAINNPSGPRLYKANTLDAVQ